MAELTREDCEMILESLRYTKQAFEKYEHYPSYDFKQKRLAEVEAVHQKVLAIKGGKPC